MLTNDFLGDEVGRLGLGTMRLPVIDGDQSRIDQSKLDEMVDVALEAGVNYFDTAYPYHENMSEIAIGRSLGRHPRESFYLATKYPGHQIADTYDPAAIFEEQLQKCGVGYFDFYLLHNVYENSIQVYEDERWKIMDYFVEQKRTGRIRHLGFSSHGRPENLQEFLDYGAMKYAELLESDPETAAMFHGENVLEFCQIQLNYLDWTLQHAARKCEILEDLQIPAIVMEPLRGGKLVDLAEDQLAQMRAKNATRTPAEWSFRWLQAIPNVKVVLSGMSSLEQLEQNIDTFDASEPLAADEVAMLMDVAEMLKGGVPCTQCRYCVSSCPQSIDIPVMMATYNDLQYSSSVTVSMQMDALPAGQRAQDCIACGACALVCPQSIDIPDVMAKLAVELEKLPSWEELCRKRAEAAARSQA